MVMIGTSRRSRVTRTLLVVLQVFLLLFSAIGPAATYASDPPPSADPSPSPSEEPTPAPTPEPTAEPTAEPTPAAEPTPDPTPEPAPDPVRDPIASPDPTPDPTTAPTPDPTPASTPAPTSPFIVAFAAGVTSAEQLAALDAAGATSNDTISALRMHAVSASAAAVAALRDDARVTSVELDRSRAAEADPNDSLYPDQWALPKIGWDQVFGTSIGGSATVAIFDTGVDGSQPELAGKLVAGTSLLETSATTDPNGHGTAMAGIVAAGTNNGSGIAGVGYDGVRIMPVTVLGSDGTGRDSDVIEGLVWAADHGADVALMAFSASGYSSALQTAIDYSWSKGVVLVAATGNDGSSSASFPAGDRGVVGVSNTDQSDTLNASSNYGADTFLAAPGTDILTVVPGGGTTSVTGTSASAAHVAAAAALLRAADGSLSNGVIVGRLARTADAAGTVAQTGNGRLNLARAFADTSTGSVQPAGAAPVGDGGPFVGPYVVAAPSHFNGFVYRDTNGNGLDDDGQLGLAGAQVKLFEDDGSTAGVFDGSDTQIGVTITTPATGVWSFGSGLKNNTTYFITQTPPSGFTASAAIVGPISNNGSQPSTIVVDAVNRFKIVSRNGSPDFGNNRFLDKVANSAPTATTPTFSPASPLTNDSLTASTTTADADGNNVSVAWTWKVTRGTSTCVVQTNTSASAPVGSRSVSLNLATGFVPVSCVGPTINPFNPSKGDVVTVEATPNDGTVNGTLVSNTVIVANSAPVVTNVVITPSSPTTNQSIIATPTATDADGDTVTFTYQWQKKVAGVLTNIPGATTASLDLSIAGNGDKGDELRVLVTPNDGTVNGAQFTSTSVTVVNSAPVVTNVVISPSSPTTNQTITATPTATDADADTVTFTYQWQKKVGAGSFTDIAGATSASLDLSIAGNGDKGDELRVLVTPNDGTVNGAQFTSSPVTVVNSAPVCEDVAITTDEDTVGSTAPECTDDDAEALTYTVTTATTGVSGTDTTSILTFDPNGQFESLDDTEFETDAFTYTASDGDASSVAADVDVTITGVNDAPVANNDTGTTNEDTVMTVAAPGVLGNDTDVDVEALTVAEVNGVAANVGSEITLASGAKVTLNADGSFSYTPSPAHQALDTGESALDSFTYRASDGTVSSNTATVTITITGVNDAPVCEDVVITTNEDAVGSTAPDCTDVDWEALTYSVTTVTTGVSGTDTTSILTFDPNGQFESLDDTEDATDAFTYTAFDGTESSVAADVNVTITGVNDAPVCLAVDILTDEDTAGSAAPDCTDVDIETLTYTVTDAAFGDAGTDGSTSLTFDPNGQFESLDDTEDATDAFTYTAFDGTDSSVAADVNVTITGVNDAPVAGAITTTNGTPNEGQPTSVTLAFTDVDIESHTCTFVWGDSTPNTVFSVNSSATDCTASHTYGDDEPGAADDIYSVSVTVTDGDLSASKSIGITVSNVKPSLNTPVFMFNPFTGAATASIKFTDPGWPDTHIAVFAWGDGGTTTTSPTPSEHLQPDATGTFSATHTYAATGCVPTAPTVTVTDDDGGATVYTYVASLDHYVVAFQAPIQDGMRNIVKQGNVIPVKLQITDCAGHSVLGKTLSIGYIAGDAYDDDAGGPLYVPDSVSGADTTGFMRQVDSKYMYNLATKTLNPNMPYTVVVREPSTSLFVASFVIQSKK